eukprot:g3298.t1
MPSYERNALILGFGFFGIFMAFNTAQSLATSLPGGPENLGYMCLAALYGTFTVACFFVPPWIKKIGPKYAMIIGGVPYVLMVGATLKPSYWLSIPMNVLVGIGAPLLWTGSSVYIGRCAVWQAYTDLTLDSDHKKRISILTARFNSIFFMLFQGNGTLGLLLSSLVLRVAGSNAVRYLFILLVLICGIGVFILTLIPKVEAKEKANAKTLSISLMDDVDSDAVGASKSDFDAVNDEIAEVSWKDTLILACTDRKMTLLIPIIFYNGLSLAFMFGDFTSLIIQQSLSLKNTGFVVATFYFVNAAFTYLAGTIGVKNFGRTPFLAIATVCHVAFFVWMLLWSAPDNYEQQCSVDDCLPGGSCSGNSCLAPYGPNERHSDKYEFEINTPSWDIYFRILLGAAVFGIGDAVWESFPAGIIQYMYKDSDKDLVAASANLKMWQSLGFAVQFVFGIVLKNYFNVKVAILLASQIVGAACLVVVHACVQSLDFKAQGNIESDDENDQGGTEKRPGRADYDHLSS